MTQPRYTIHVCPVCWEQVEDDHDYGYVCFHWRDYIDAVEFEVGPPMALNWRNNPPGLEAKLADLKRKDECWTAQLEWWASLPKEEKDRREEERLAAMSPIGRAMEQVIRGSIEDSRKLFERPLWGSLTIPKREEK